MKQRTYFIGVSKRGKTIVVQAAECNDDLSCEIYLYYGERITTKKNLKDNKQTLFNEFVKLNPFKECKYITVE
jgi:hypothetical protein